MGTARDRQEYGISSWIARAPLLELDRRGIDAGRVLARNGLTREQLLDPEGWIPLRLYAAYFRDACRVSEDGAFAISVGRRLPIQSARAAGYAAGTSATLREACETLGRYNALLRDGSRIGTRHARGFDAVLTRRPPAFPVHEDQPTWAASILDFFAFATGKLIWATEIHMTGPTPAAGSRIGAALGAPIRWEAPGFEMRFPQGTLDAPVDHADPVLRSTLEEAARRELVMRAADRMSDRVRAAILALGFDGSASVSLVAKSLGTSTRTLQRKLGEESLTYSAVREDVLRAAAVDMLSEGSGPTEEVALRLGFSSRAGFHEAVRRWTGRTPGQLRAAAADREP